MRLIMIYRRMETDSMAIFSCLLMRGLRIDQETIGQVRGVAMPPISIGARLETAIAGVIN